MRARVVATWATVAMLTGCGGSARFVQSDASGGVVAIPANTNSWPNHYHDSALELISKKCPNGYEIVSEQEVVTGKVSSTNAQTNTQENPTLVIPATDTGGKPGRKDPNALPGAVAIPMGETRRTTQQTTTYQNTTEWRIEYRAK